MSEGVGHGDNFFKCAPLARRCSHSKLLFNKIIWETKPTGFLSQRHGEGDPVLHRKDLEVLCFRFDRELRGRNVSLEKSD